ncbi:MFS general substrate transporter [Athelia psychrophila]|uniref:MFS general substrate transporter n=1 Tax=Athelia psychrophila TaxID=1759441 RepID=A0A166RM01_9AGAM|nr:MFS general substrate transporter [Fibularhizoctonia sp. CBS 109695]
MSVTKSDDRVSRETHGDLESTQGSPRLDTRTFVAVQAEQEAHLGVKTVEAAERVYGRFAKWFLFIGLGLASYIYSLDSSTTYTYLAFAASSFGEHSLISSIQVAQAIIVAVGKPVIAKTADVSSRGYSYLGVVIFYVVGYIVIASAKSVGTIAGGLVVYAVGYTGLQLLQQIIIADITTLKWRGLVSSLVSTPFLINAFVGANISAYVLEHAGWRWGYGMFAILIPAALAPLIITLLWAEGKAKRLGIVEARSAAAKDQANAHISVFQRLARLSAQMDIIGLILIAAAVALILLPLTLSQTAKGGWNNASMIAMLVLGVVLLFVFGLWDIRYASFPVVAPRFVRNRSVVAASFIGFFDFVSFYLTYTYLYSFVIVVQDWALVDSNYFIQTQSVALTFFGIIAGFILRYTQRYKWTLVVGLIIRIVGVGLMIHSRGANGSATELVWCQILQGMGGGISAVTAQVGAQASVTHSDVAMVTAVVLLLTEIGGAVGTAIAGAIWTNTMPQNLEKYLPFLNATEIATIYGNIALAGANPRGDPTREGVIHAYDDTMKIMVILATCVSVIPICFALIMPNWYLGDKQNAVDNADLAGHLAGEEDIYNVDEVASPSHSPTATASGLERA